MINCFCAKIKREPRTDPRDHRWLSQELWNEPKIVLQLQVGRRSIPQRFDLDYGSVLLRFICNYSTRIFGRQKKKSGSVLETKPDFFKNLRTNRRCPSAPNQAGRPFDEEVTPFQWRVEIPMTLRSLRFYLKRMISIFGRIKEIT